MITCQLEKHLYSYSIDELHSGLDRLNRMADAIRAEINNRTGAPVRYAFIYKGYQYIYDTQTEAYDAANEMEPDLAYHVHKVYL